MSTNANYANSSVIGAGTTTTADTSYTQPTNSTVGVIITDTTTGTRIDNLDHVTLGTAVAGLLRLWLCDGTVGPTVSSITFTTTTATVTTQTSHGLSTGVLITLQGAFPVDYNMKNVAITVTGLTTFTYTMSTTPTINASTVGAYSSTPATPVYHLLREFTITAATGSTVAAAQTQAQSSVLNNEFMPIILQAGWSLRTTVTVTQTSAFKTTARGGKF